MNDKTVLILERSSQNLQKISKGGKTVLEGVFAEFGIENRNGRIYEEAEYLPHLEYLKKDMTNGSLLGELDHPERFEVSLSNVSHKISELWYDQQLRQVKGRIEILDGTPKGAIAKSLLEAGIPLSISSRAAGTVNEDKTVSIQQIYTYDLVAKPGFEAAQLQTVNESADPNAKRIANLMESLNNSAHNRDVKNISSKLGIVNENISIIDVTDKFPSVKLREEAIALKTQKIENNQMEKPNVANEEAVQQWTVFFKKELSSILERLDRIEGAVITGDAGNGSPEEIKLIKGYIEKLRTIQESALNWQSDIAKALNKVGDHAQKMATKSNEHYDLTKKLVETVNFNAETLNHTQDWVGENAKVTNAIGATVDHNATMLNGINEWNTQLAKAVNKLNEWGEEKAAAINDMHEWVGTQAKAVNSMHEWTSSIAKNLNGTTELLDNALTKETATKLIEYIELVAESKQNPELKKRINEMLKKTTFKPLNEKGIKSLTVITSDTLKKVGKTAVTDTKDKSSDVEIDKNKAIISKFKNIKFKKNDAPKELKSKIPVHGDKAVKVGSEKQLPTLSTTKVVAGTGKDFKSGDGPKNQKQNLKLDQKPAGKGLITELNRTDVIKTRSSKLDEKLSKIVDSLEKERAVDEGVKGSYPFTKLLNESDRKRFANLSATDKTKVADKIANVPTTEPEVIVKLWEDALASNKVEEPLWLKIAPADYKAAYERADEKLKEGVKARSEFYNLDTQYQINNFWEQSGLVIKPKLKLNETVVAKGLAKNESTIDPFIAEIGEQMKKYQR